MIRLVGAPDAALLGRLAAIHEQAFAPEARGWTAEEIGRLAREGELYVSPHGFMLIRKVLDEAEVLTIAIALNDQGARHGTALLTHVLDNNSEITFFLEVAADNAPALRLYLATGFQEVGRRKGYYLRKNGAKVDAFTMRRLPS